MKINDLIESLRQCAEFPDRGKCDERCPVFAQSSNRPYCCFDMFREAADRLEEMDERIAIMEE